MAHPKMYDEADPLLAEDRSFSPPYLGPSGRLARDLTPDAGWDDVAELLAPSYREVATAAVLADLDLRWPPATAQHENDHA